MHDQPTHATSSRGATHGQTIPIAPEANTPLEDNYHDIATTKTKQMDTYANRMSTLSEKLGNKDSVKG